MKASSSASAAAATTMAFSTKAAGPSLQIFSKTDSIAQSRVSIRAALRPPLVRRHKGYVLARGEPEPQSAAVGLRSKASNLVGLRKVLRTDGKENVPGKLRCAPSAQLKPQARAAGGPPFHTGAGEGAACSDGCERK